MIITGDSGGSKSLLRVYNENICVEEITFEGLGVPSDSIEDIPILAQKLSELKFKYPIDAVAFNLGGRNKMQIERVIRKVFPNTPFKVFRESEGFAALSIASCYHCECVLLAGTGTISIAKHPKTDQITINGGWGYLLGDEGSGYHIGLNALRQCVGQADSVGGLDLLSRTILEREHAISCESDGRAICQTRDSLFQKLAPLSREHIASFTRVVASCCEKQDPFSLKLMQDAGESMAELVAKSLRKLDLNKVNGVLITGGLVNVKQFWQESFEESLKKQFVIDRFYYIPDGLSIGTQLIANSLRVK